MATPDIDEINKIRKAVGLPLLPSANAPSDSGPTFKEHHSDDSDGEPASTLDTREAAGFENFRQLQEDERRRIEREKRKRDLQKARDAAARFTKLEGKGLGDAGEQDDLDARAWLRGTKSRQAKIEKLRAEQLEKELVERERLASIEYKSSDLAGVKVSHEIGDFDQGVSEQILTLKDTEIGKDEAGEEEDILENADIIARDKLKEKLDLKKKKVYDVHGDTGEKGLLSQYDEKERKAFTLDNQGSGIEARQAKRQEIGDKLKSTISLDVLKPEVISDYAEIKIRKPKKEKKNKRKREDDDEDIFIPNGTSGDTMEVDGANITAQHSTKTQNSNFNDDEDLAGALALSRKANLKKQKRRPEDIAKLIKEEEAEEARAAAAAENEGGLTLDDTTTFLDNLSSRPPEEEEKTKVRQSVEEHDEQPSPDADGDETMGEAHAIGDGDEAELLDRMRREQQINTPEISHTGLEEEQTSNQGTAAMLNLLKQRGLVKDSDAGDQNNIYKQRQNFILEARLREHEAEQRARAQRERDRQSGKMSGMSLKEREEHARWQNSQREHQTSLQAAAAFNRDYKPNVQIKYIDDQGRSLNQKEAFKHMSHQFHGKGSGKQKTEKHIKKIEDEKRRMAASVLDSSQATGMSNAAGAQSKKNKEAGVRLA